MPRKKLPMTVKRPLRALKLDDPEPEPAEDSPPVPRAKTPLLPPFMDGGNGNGNGGEAEADDMEDVSLFSQPPQLPSSVAPQVEATGRTRFETPVREDVLVTSHETFENLAQFFGNLPDRERFEISVWRCDAANPSNVRKRAWKGRIPLPTTCTLEEAIDREYGGGVYYWRLGCENRHASRADLPADYQALPMSGYAKLETEPKVKDEPAVDPQLEARLQKAEGAQSELLGFLKEMLRDKKDSAKNEGAAMTQLMTVILTAGQQQMQMAQQQANQMQQFLLAMLANSEKKAAEASEHKETVLQMMMEAAKGEVTGEKSMGQTIVESLPRILEGLSKVPALSQPSPRLVQQPPPPPVQVRAPAVTVVPAQAPAPPAPAPAVEDDYPTAIAKRCIAGWSAKEPCDSCADAIEEIGTDENFNDLLDTPDEQVIMFLATGFKAANNQPAPEELLAYARTVLKELHFRYPDEQAAPAAPAPVAPVPAAPTVQVVTNAPAQGQAAG